jgi:Ca2+-binding EF-hand superfamily protein
MRKYLISAHVQLSYSYLLGEISHEEYVRMINEFGKIMTMEEVVEALRQVDETIKGME